MEHIKYLSQLVTEMVSEFRGEVAVGESFSFVYDGLKFNGRVYERFNDHQVVVFEVEVCTTKLTRAKQELINRLNGQLPFTAFRVSKAADACHTITAMHSLSVSGVVAEHIVEALNSIAYQVREQGAALSRTTDSSRSVEQILRDEVKRRSEEGIERIKDGVDDDLDDKTDDKDDVRTDDDSAAARRARRPRVRTSTTTTAQILADLRRMVGLEPVKIEVERLVAAREFTRARVAGGLPADRAVAAPRLHRQSRHGQDHGGAHGRRPLQGARHPEKGPRGRSRLLQTDRRVHRADPDQDASHLRAGARRRALHRRGVRTDVEAEPGLRARGHRDVAQVHGRQPRRHRGDRRRIPDRNAGFPRRQPRVCAAGSTW